MEEIRDRAMIWVYEIVKYDTGEIIKVLSRKFIKEFLENLHGSYYLDCLGGFDYLGEFREF